MWVDRWTDGETWFTALQITVCGPLLSPPYKLTCLSQLIPKNFQISKKWDKCQRRQTKFKTLSFNLFFLNQETLEYAYADIFLTDFSLSKVLNTPIIKLISDWLDYIFPTEWEDKNMSLRIKNKNIPSSMKLCTVSVAWLPNSIYTAICTSPLGPWLPMMPSYIRKLSFSRRMIKCSNVPDFKFG